ncbi:MAG: Fic family protein [Fimbriimonadaceae bacterium]
MQYLTVQDMIWINTQVTGAPQPYYYATLEEATFYQYGYGKSTDLFAQAARFFQGFKRLHPFKAGNEATALVGLIAFLELNGQNFLGDVSTVRDWLEGKHAEGVGLVEALKLATRPAENHDESVSAQQACSGALARLTAAVGDLRADYAQH